jgi:hypothetical protein
MTSRFDTIAGCIELDGNRKTSSRHTLTLRDLMLLRDAVDVIAPSTPAETKAVDRLRRIFHEHLDAPAG